MTAAPQPALEALKKWRYAPGNYSCLCLDCGSSFDGDKRATTCRPCAEKSEAAYEAPEAAPQAGGLAWAHQWLAECAAYFTKRDTGGEDRAHWANVYNVENCQKISAAIERLERQLPDGMKHCTISFKECEKGHCRLTATNWIDHGCPTCAIATIRAETVAECAKVADMFADVNIEAAGDTILMDPIISGKRPVTAYDEALSKALTQEGGFRSSMFHAAQNIAAAIRALTTGPKGGTSNG